MYDAVNSILQSLVMMNGGEIFIPKLKSYKIEDLANKISKKHKIIGLRPGEKFEEYLLSKEEKLISKETKVFWIIKPDIF